jgi:hypothetical protein
MEVREWIRLLGLLLMVVSVTALITGQSAGDCLVLAVVGFGLSRWLIAGGE